MNGPNDTSGIKKKIPKQCIWYRFGPIMLLSPTSCFLIPYNDNRI